MSFFLFCFIIISLFIGSFLNVVIYRLPLMLQRRWEEDCRSYLGQPPLLKTPSFNLCFPASHCPQCQKPIRPWHNIPLLSFILLKGKCSNCKNNISLRYPMVELLTCVLSVYVAWQFHSIVYFPQLFATLIFTWIGICLIFIDIDHHLLPDQLTLLLLWLGMIFTLFGIFVPSESAIIGAVTGYLFFAITQAIFGFFTGKIGLGQGDYKLLAALGALLGYFLLPFIVILASVLGLIGALLQMIRKRSFKSVPFAFGPYLLIAGWIALFWGRPATEYWIRSCC